MSFQISSEENLSNECFKVKGKREQIMNKRMSLLESINELSVIYNEGYIDEYLLHTNSQLLEGMKEVFIRQPNRYKLELEAVNEGLQSIKDRLTELECEYEEAMTSSYRDCEAVPF